MNIINNLDLIKKEIRDTYYVGDEGSLYEINGCAFLGDSIIVATNQGLFFANKNSQNLSDYNNWNIYSEQPNQEAYDNIVCGNTEIYGDYTFETTSISYNNNTLIHEEEEHQQENNATKKTPSFVEHVESFYEANEENVQKAGFAAAVALFLLLVYCVWKRLRRRRIGRGGTSRGGKSAAEKNTREGREEEEKEEEEKEDNAEERE